MEGLPHETLAVGLPLFVAMPLTIQTDSIGSHWSNCQPFLWAHLIIYLLVFHMHAFAYVIFTMLPC